MRWRSINDLAVTLGGGPMSARLIDRPESSGAGFDSDILDLS